MLGTLETEQPDPTAPRSVLRTAKTRFFFPSPGWQVRRASTRGHRCCPVGPGPGCAASPTAASTHKRYSLCKQRPAQRRRTRYTFCGLTARAYRNCQACVYAHVGDRACRRATRRRSREPLLDKAPYTPACELPHSPTTHLDPTGPGHHHRGRWCGPSYAAWHAPPTATLTLEEVEAEVNRSFDRRQRPMRTHPVHPSLTACGHAAPHTTFGAFRSTAVVGGRFILFRVPRACSPRRNHLGNRRLA